MDNEVSGELKATATTHSIQYQLAPPPHMHIHNTAERAIQTFKKYFIAGLATTSPNFPMSEWDRLIKQGLLTLNLLHNERINPKLSSQDFLHSFFDFNKNIFGTPWYKSFGS